ncbi:MAG: hypothetical protein RPU64_04110 [Candidatus Sedimenticola sp. (ex Thyasira tokunagai)]
MSKEELLEASGKIGLDVCVLVFAYSLHILSAILDLSGAECDWYSRSGSLLVIFSAYLETRTFSFRQKLNQMALKETAGWDARPQDYVMPKKRALLDKFVLLTLIYGTVVWGYGDLLL